MENHQFFFDPRSSLRDAVQVLQALAQHEKSKGRFFPPPGAPWKTLLKLSARLQDSMIYAFGRLQKRQTKRFLFNTGASSDIHIQPLGGLAQSFLSNRVGVHVPAHCARMHEYLHAIACAFACAHAQIDAV